MKKLTLSVLIVANLTFANDADFKKGFETAVEAVKLELINGSNLNRTLNYTGDKLLYLNTSHLSTNEILLSQFIAFSNGFTDLGFSGERLYFGSYIRDADRDVAKRKLENLLGYKIEKESNGGRARVVTPILDRSFYIAKRNVVEGAIKRSEYTYYQTQRQQATKPNASYQFFIPKSGVDVFNVSDGVMMRIGQSSDTQKLKYEKTIMDTDGIQYVKASGSNRYFRMEDVKFTSTR